MTRLSDAEIRERGLKVEDVRAGEARMQDFRERERVTTHHDYGKHRGNDWNARCEYCLEALTEACHRLSDWIHDDPDAIPAGFRRG